jgi:AraC-like DNA-binding protein
MGYGRFNTIRIPTISEYFRHMGWPKPQHPLISVINFEELKTERRNHVVVNFIFDFYAITMKRMKGLRYKYGQHYYDFEDDGILFFLSPNQVFNIEPIEQAAPEKPSGWALFIHPDFFWNTTLAKTIKQYDFFDYAINEALLLSEKEEVILNEVIRHITQEYQSNIDKFTKQIIVTHVENLLSYCERFYNRQFITREKASHQVLDNLEKLLTGYFNNDNLMAKGLPTVRYVSDQLNVSVSYLSRLLKVLTGQTTQQHIHNKLIEKANEKLSTTTTPVSEIAYSLGFEHSQAFSRLFKSKTNQSPLVFRRSYN